MYSLLSRIPEGLDPLRTRFEEHVRKAGLNAIEKIADQGGETMVNNLIIYTFKFFFKQLIFSISGTKNIRRRTVGSP